MCGIVGAVSFNQVPLKHDVCFNMANEIKHRGPDGSGFCFFDKSPDNISCQELCESTFVAQSPTLAQIDMPAGQAIFKKKSWQLFLGHRRLAVIAPSPAGRQPFSDPSRKYWLSYNGEIYNYKELREELIKLGFSFVTETDTEVVLTAYRAWGIDCVKRFNGMFAFALYDLNKQKLFLARDRYGIKPLYYTVTKNRKLLFASEVKALQADPDFKNEVDCLGLAEYFSFQNFFNHRTLLKDVHLLSPASYFEIDLQKPLSLVEKSYWDFNFEESGQLRSDKAYQDEFVYLFEQAVKRQLRSDVELGAYLSGGMDSGSITHVAARHIENLKTFTVGFDLNNVSGLELAFDERENAEMLSYLNKTEQYEMVLKSGDMERCMKDFAYHLEEPRVGQSYPNFYAAKLASRFVKVVLAGTGGDELFGGYPWRYYRAASSDNFEHYIDNYFAYWQRLTPNNEISQLLQPVSSSVGDINMRQVFQSVFKTHHETLTSTEDYINHSLYFEAKTFLPGLLMVEDKLSMAHSLETRVPFLDNDLVDFAMSLPVKHKLANLSQTARLNENVIGKKPQQYFNQTHDGKLLLRKALAQYMPERIVKGKKQGFSSPDNCWFKGDSIEFVKRHLTDKKRSVFNFLDHGYVQKKLTAHLNGQQNNRLFIWSVLNFEYWCQSNGF